MCCARRGELCTMKYEGIILHPSRFISLTSLKPEEFVFLLGYLKNNPLQNFKVATFDISQPKVSKITEILLPILDDTLKKLSTAVKKNASCEE